MGEIQAPQFNLADGSYDNERMEVGGVGGMGGGGEGGRGGSPYLPQGHSVLPPSFLPPAIASARGDCQGFE